MVRSLLPGLPSSVRRRYALKVALVFIVLAAAIAVLGGAATVVLQDEVEQNVLESYATFAHVESQNLANWNEQNERTTHLLSENVEERENQSAIREYLREEQLTFSRTVHDVHYVDVADERVVASTSDEVEGRTFSSLGVPWAEPGTAVPDVVTRTEVYRGPNVSGGRALIAYVAPVGETGTDRVLVLTVRPSSYTPLQSPLGQSQTIVVDESDRVVVSQEFVTLLPYADDDAGRRPIEAARRVGTERAGSMIVPASTTVSDALLVEPGSPVVVGYNQVRDTGWIVLVHVPVSTAFGFARTVTTGGIVATVLGVVAIGVVGWWFGRTTAAELDHLTSTAQRLQAGEDVSVSTSRTDAIGQLYVAFDRMATEIRERERALRAQAETLEDERNRLASLFENATDAVAHLSFDDGHHEILAVNPAFDRTFGSHEAGAGTPRLGEYVTPADDGADLVVDDPRSVGDGVEIRLETTTGVRDFLVRFVPVGDGESPTEGYVAFTDITERKESQRELERHRDLLERTERLAGVGGLEVSVESGRLGEARFTDELYRIHDLPDRSPVEFETVVERYHPDDRERVRSAIREAIETGGQYDVEARLVTDGDHRWIRTTGEAITEDGTVVKVRGALQDITRRKRHQLALESLHDVAQELLQIRDEREVAELVVGSATDVLSLPGVGIFLFDPETNQLRPAAVSTNVAGVFVEPSPVEPSDGGSAIWEAFASGEPVVDVHTVESESAEPTGGERRFHCFPIGEHGVFVIGSDTDAIDARTRQLAELLVATTEAALDRVENERAVRERDEQLQEQNRRLRDQVRVNEIIRRIDDALVEATSREAIETAVCDRLAAVGEFKLAWIGEYEPGKVAPTPSYWSGAGADYLDAITLDATNEPSVRAVDTGQVTVVDNVVEDVRREAWRREALAREFQSVISVPLVRDGYTYSVLTVYAAEAGAFGRLEREVFAELGETIVNAITAVETRRALETDRVVELRLRVDDADALLPRLARDLRTRVELEGTAGSDGRTRLFFTVDGVEPGDVIDALDGFVTVDDARHVAETDDGHLFEASVRDATLAAALAERGASLEGLTADGHETTLEVVVPAGTDVRQFIDELSQVLPGVALLARRDVERPIQTLSDLRTAILDELTDRQREVLLTTYYSGYYEWPRVTTGEEVASMLGVSQPTVNRHLRFAQRTVLSALLDSDVDVADGEA